MRDAEAQRLREMEAAESERAESESDDTLPVPARVTVQRGAPRARNLQVKFREDEFADLAAYAEQRGLPVSTVVRMLVLQANAPVDDLKAALGRLESDVIAVRRQVLST